MRDGRARQGAIAWLERHIVGESPAIRSLRAELAALAAVPFRSVLILGESGSGKELVPRALVALSPQLGGRLEIFNCPAVPSDHLEAELFGTTSGAYPGAHDRPGAVERASRGLLFLDEIAAMPVAHQPKVLRLLEDGDYRRLGARTPARCGACFAAATHEDLPARIARGTFREDLYYRLVQDGVVRVPPLRERPEDVGPLARHLLAELPQPADLAREAEAELRLHPWPGNVRELRAVLRCAARLADGRAIGAREVAEARHRVGLPARGHEDRAAEPASGGAFEQVADGLRRSLLEAALERAGGNQTLAGLMLGLHRRPGSPAAPVDMQARKRAHRRFRYWWARLGGGSLAGGGGSDDPGAAGDELI